MKNIVLIGMPGAGKTTLGKAIANDLKMNFIDGDELIIEKTGLKLQQILNDQGIDKFFEIEESVLSEVNVENTVIATGGSAVYSDKAMQNLKKNGLVVFIYSSFEDLEKRLTNLDSRGVVFKPGYTLKTLFDEREPLYEKYADITINGTGTGISGLKKQLLNRLSASNE